MSNDTTMSNANDEMSVKWYREFYVWLLIFFPVMSIFMGITTIVLSVNSYDGLVVDDYYKRGLAINEILARDEKADQLGLSSSLHVNADEGQIAVRLSAAGAFDYPDQIDVNFMHATRGGHDQSLKLSRTAKGSYQGNLTSLQPGHWHVEIAADNWRLLDSYWQEL